MNLPNVLTLSRIVFAAILVILLEENTLMGNIGAVVVFTIASITDYYDGYFAKTKGLISNFGKIMDPIADKILILSVFAVFAHLNIIPWWMVIVIAIREIAVTISRLLAMQKGLVLAAEKAGKIKTVAQIMAISFILLYLVASQGAAWFGQVQKIWQSLDLALMLVVVGLTVYSGIDYFRMKNEKCSH